MLGTFVSFAAALDITPFIGGHGLPDTAKIGPSSLDPSLATNEAGQRATDRTGRDDQHDDDKHSSVQSRRHRELDR